MKLELFLLVLNLLICKSLGVVFDNYYAVHGTISFTSVDDVYTKIGNNLKKRFTAITNPDTTLPFENELHGDRLRLFNLASTKVDPHGRRETKKSVVAAQKIFKLAKSKWEAKKQQISSVEGLVKVPECPSIRDYVENYFAGLQM